MRKTDLLLKIYSERKMENKKYLRKCHINVISSSKEDNHSITATKTILQG